MTNNDVFNDFIAPTGALVAARTYYRFNDGVRETWSTMTERCIEGLKELGKLTDDEAKELEYGMLTKKVLPSGRWLWVGGTDWIKEPKNYYGAYNCNSTSVESIDDLANLMALGMMGCGTGAVLEIENVQKLPSVKSRILLTIDGKPGDYKGQEKTFTYKHYYNQLQITVGDSREGWCKAYKILIEAATSGEFPADLEVVVKLGGVRGQGQPIKGFGGTANPEALPQAFKQIVKVLNGAFDRKLTSVEVTLLIDEVGLAIVAGNVRRFAAIKQFSNEDKIAMVAKDNLWVQNEDGKWSIDPDRSALRMSNHTRVYHHKPTLEECITSVTKQYYSGEGAIQWAGEAVARANADVVPLDKKKSFLKSYAEGMGDVWLEEFGQVDPSEVEERLSRYGINPCAEVVMSNNFCNLSEVHLNQLTEASEEELYKAFYNAGKMGAILLHHQFDIPKYQKSRELDPIVGVSFTGLFDYFVDLFGVSWLEWWAEGRPNNDDGIRFKNIEALKLNQWRQAAEDGVRDYCEKHGLKVPNRCTLIQPGGTKSLLTGASCGWHPPKAARYIRRITFRAGDPVAKACIDYGYSVVPGQNDKDAYGQLLEDYMDPRVTEWLVEVPVETIWANIPGADKIDISKFSALAQMDFYMQVQKNYSRHTTSATIELREDEIEPLATKIHQLIQDDEGYVSVAMLARFDSLETFPRLPFEPIGEERYLELVEGVKNRQVSDDFDLLLEVYDQGEGQGPAGCDSDKCLFSVVEK